MDDLVQVVQGERCLMGERVLVIGASGYVGARLVPFLIEDGYLVRSAGRTKENMLKRPWSGHESVDICEVDALDRGDLKKSCEGCRYVYYLLHSMSPNQKNFMDTDRQAASNMVWAAEQSGVERIIYLGGLGEESPHLSKHLKSREEVGNILESGSVPVTILRAAMIIGSGSASFEILRYLVERLPVMVTPKWVHTQCQPIAIRNVITYLVGCLKKPETVGETYDIGGAEILTYRDLMDIYAHEARLGKRFVIPVPVLTPKLSSYWIHLVTPVPASLGRPLAEGLSNKVICEDNRIRDIIPQDLLDCREAMSLALDQSQHNLIGENHNDLYTMLKHVEWSFDGDPKWAGGKIFEDHRAVVLESTPDRIWKPLLGIGGKNGWYYANWLWKLRGLLDLIVGGVGMRPGRTDPNKLTPGDYIDFWNIHLVEPNKRLLLKAEMKLPGSAILDFYISPTDDKHSELHQIARFIPSGLLGIIYWYAVKPFHNLIFNGMLRRIAERVGDRVISEPKRITGDITLNRIR